MKAKNITIFCLSCLALVATLVMAICFFFANQPIKNVPIWLKIENVQGQICLVSSYGGDCNYVFKLEQKVGPTSYVVVQQVETSANILNLSSTKLGIVAGQEYQFSVKYKSGLNEGEFCQPILWQGKKKLQDVNLKDAIFEDGTLDWKDVSGADYYTVKVVSANGTISTINANTSEILLSGKVSGNVKVYVMAHSKNVNILSSNLSGPKQVEV